MKSTSGLGQCKLWPVLAPQVLQGLLSSRFISHSHHCPGNQLHTDTTRQQPISDGPHTSSFLPGAALMLWGGNSGGISLALTPTRPGMERELMMHRTLISGKEQEKDPCSALPSPAERILSHISTAASENPGGVKRLLTSVVANLRTVSCTDVLSSLFYSSLCLTPDSWDHRLKNHYLHTSPVFSQQRKTQDKAPLNTLLCPRSSIINPKVNEICLCQIGFSW